MCLVATIVQFLIQILQKVLSKTLQLIGRHDSADRRSELSLGIELTQLREVGAQIVVGQSGIVLDHPRCPQSLLRIQSLGRIDGEEAGN